MKTIQNLLREESGATAVEYVAITALASVGILAFFGGIEGSLVGDGTNPGSGVATGIADKLDNIATAGGTGGGTGD
ncbi:hypothetical protein [Roseovarius sp. MBR-6]|jgi:Flp pilus assembly pilin Flp|uniref:Flp family type IVb pilin n=1 Tax=Roseovarius sp. MBR-6 TaxID=3156459 RepID=UPI0033974682